MPTSTTATGLVANAVEIATAVRKIEAAREQALAATRDLSRAIDDDYEAVGLTLEGSMDIQRRCDWIAGDLDGTGDVLSLDKLHLIQRQADELVDLADFHKRGRQS